MAEGTTTGRKRGLMIGLAVFLLWAIGATLVVTFVVLRPPDFSGSPDASRDVPTYDDDSPVGLLEQLSLPPRSGRPAAEPFVKPIRIDGTDDNFVLHWQGEEAIGAETLPERVAPGLLDDDAIELFAFATWIPGADDELEVTKEYDPGMDAESVSVTNGDWKAALTFRDPTTLEIFSTEQLDELKIPQSFRKVPPPERYKTGVIRLLFRCANMNPVRFVGGNGGDSVTGAQVTYKLSSLEDRPDQAVDGEWAHYDFTMLLWHDKPLTFHVQLLTGEPEYGELAQQIGKQVVFGERLRLQWLAREDGYFNPREGDFFTPKPGVDHELLKGIAKLSTEEEYLNNFGGGFAGALPSLSAPSALAGPLDTSTEPDADTEPETDEKTPARFQIENDFAAHIKHDAHSSETTKPDIFFRISDQKYVDHLGRIDEDGAITWDFKTDGKSDEIRFANCKQTKDPNMPLQLVFLPHLVELTFEIAGTPDMPNQRNIEDLFDQEIPRLTLSGSSPSSAETELFQFIAVATQSGMEQADLWNESWPSSMPADRTFRNTTPQLMLNWYLKTSPEAFIEQDTDRHLLLVNQDEETFWSKVVDFLLQR